MKKHFSLLLGIALLLSTCTASFAAIHEYGNDDTTTDTWYTIETKKPYLMGSLRHYDPSLDLNFELYHNEQTFFDFLYETDDVNDEIIFKGSYLFSNNFFLGGYVDYTKDKIFDQADSFWGLSPGYRLNFDHGYAAVSINIGETTNDQVEFLGIDFDGQYLFDNAKIEGELFIPNNGDASLSVQGRLKVIEELVVGLDLGIHGDNSDLAIGATYIPMPELILDLLLSDNYSDLSGMYYLDNFGMGMEYISNANHGQIFLKGKYKLSGNKDNGSLVLKYGLENEHYSQMIILGYQQAL